MRIKDGFVIRKVARQYVAVAVGENEKTFHGMVKLNETAKIIWEELAKGSSEEEIVQVLLAKTDAPQEIVAADVRAMIAELDAAGFLLP